LSEQVPGDEICGEMVVHTEAQPDLDEIAQNGGIEEG
jgi:hypothetical protein